MPSTKKIGITYREKNTRVELGPLGVAVDGAAAAMDVFRAAAFERGVTFFAAFFVGVFAFARAFCDFDFGLV
jgi:hypothetical protein|tara:strand:+ start:5161 stop:5376 length:216 start_codon:yes stop_codon:yes gene_type:complete